MAETISPCRFFICNPEFGYGFGKRPDHSGELIQQESVLQIAPLFTIDAALSLHSLSSRGRNYRFMEACPRRMHPRTAGEPKPLLFRSYIRFYFALIFECLPGFGNRLPVTVLHFEGMEGCKSCGTIDKNFIFYTSLKKRTVLFCGISLSFEKQHQAAGFTAARLHRSDRQLKEMG